MILLSVFLVLIVGLLAAIYFLMKTFKYWELRGVPYIRASGISGSLKGQNDKHICIIFKEWYDKLKTKSSLGIGGMFFGPKPAMMVLDLNVAKNILIKDFNNFSDRGLYFNEKDDPISAHLVSVGGSKWRKLRTKLTPTFTSGKMKMMFHTINEVSDRLQSHLTVLCQSNDDIDMNEYVTRFTTDVIGSCAFGIECNTIEGENQIFREMGHRLFHAPRHSRNFQLLLFAFKTQAQKLGIKFIRDDVSQFFTKLSEDTIKYRETSQEIRNDFIQLLLELKHSDNEENRLSQNEINAQAFVFFVAGFETSSSLLTFCLYELALNRNVQENARKIVNKMYKDFDGKLTYESLADNQYLDQVLDETLRLYPPIPNLFRVSTAAYTIPDTNITLPTGMVVSIPTYAMHRDPSIYPEPEKFDPDRFSPENVKNRHPCSFLAFGDGPRNCIGLRFGMLQAKLCLAMLLKNFDITISSRMKVPVQLNPQAIFLSPVDGMWLKLTPFN